MRKYPAQFETCQDLSPYIFPHQILSSLLSLNLLHFLNPNICEKKFKIAEEGVRKLSAISKTSHRDVLTDNSPRQGSKWNSYHIPSRAKSSRRGVKKTEVRGSGGMRERHSLSRCWEDVSNYKDKIVIHDFYSRFRRSSNHRGKFSVVEWNIMETIFPLLK